VLAVDGTLYFVTSFPNYLIAIDLSKPGGALKWKFDAKPDAAAQGTAGSRSLLTCPARAS